MIVLWLAAGVLAKEPDAPVIETPVSRGGGYVRPVILVREKPLPKETEEQEAPLVLTEEELSAYLASLMAPIERQARISLAQARLREGALDALSEIQLRLLGEAALSAIAADEAENDLLLLSA